MTNPPVLDERVLELLADQLGDVTVLCTFVTRYAEMLTGRVERVQDALRAQDIDALADAVLSLKSSSEMTGATALSSAVSTLLDDMTCTPRADTWPPQDAATVVVTELRGLAAETYRVLQEFLEAQCREAQRRAATA